MPDWGFYGRQVELRQLIEIFQQERWFFVKIMGRRRIGKTALIRQALDNVQHRKVFYVQIPDSSAPGVMSAIAEAMEIFAVPSNVFHPPTSLGELASLIDHMARSGYVVVLDEFQYFNREKLNEFTSLLQAQVDELNHEAARVPGGLVVLGSIHTEMSALLEDRNAPLFARITHEIELDHLDIGSVVQVLQTHSAYDAKRLLFLWALFEGIPKFYRDCYEQNVLQAERRDLLRRLFFESSSPLKTEADNWFLKELRGRYDTILKYIARNEGCTHGEIVDQVHRLSGGTREQVGGYLKILSEKYRLVEKKLPVFSKETARVGRYFLTDNFIGAWLAALSTPVSSTQFQPIEPMVVRSDELMEGVEGHILEKLVAAIYEERGRKSLPGFSLTDRVKGYWNSKDTEIDLVAIDGNARIIRLATCKRSATKLVADVDNFHGHAKRFFEHFCQYSSWDRQYYAIAPKLEMSEREALVSRGLIPQDLDELIDGLT